MLGERFSRSVGEFLQAVEVKITFIFGEGFGHVIGEFGQASEVKTMLGLGESFSSREFGQDRRSPARQQPRLPLSLQPGLTGKTSRYLAPSNSTIACPSASPTRK